MNYEAFDKSATQDVVDLYTKVFSDSESREEGQTIGELVANLIATTDPDDLLGFVAKDGNTIVGCIFFSRFFVPNGQLAFLLSPVAVNTDTQGSGVGQGLIHYGLQKLEALSVDLVFTYGDPAYYCKTGFQQITEDIVQPPYKLSQPVGWLAQSLQESKITPMEGETKCVSAFSHAQYW